jgi:hypothetical protein
MDAGTVATGVLIAVLVGIGAFSIMYFAARLAIKDDRAIEERKRGQP